MSEIKKLESYVNFLAARNRVISENIANVGTKNYQRKDLSFKEVLTGEVNDLVRTTNQKHIGATSNLNDVDSKYEVIVDKSTDDPSGVNNVDIEREMTSLAENTIGFKMATKKINNYFRTLQEVIKGGNGG